MSSTDEATLDALSDGREFRVGGIPKPTASTDPDLPAELIAWNDMSDRGCFCVPVVLTPPDTDGIVSAHVPMLPGAVSEGRGENEALANIREALEGLLASYKDADTEPPWQSEAVEGAEPGKRYWVVVNAW